MRRTSEVANPAEGVQVAIASESRLASACSVAMTAVAEEGGLEEGGGARVYATWDLNYGLDCPMGTVEEMNEEDMLSDTVSEVAEEEEPFESQMRDSQVHSGWFDPLVVEVEEKCRALDRTLVVYVSLPVERVRASPPLHFSIR
jgi:hypothetical protein